MPGQQFSFAHEVKMSAENVAEVMVYSDIVSWKWRDDSNGVTAKEFDEALKKVSGAKRLDVRINSAGGSVYQAVAMRTMLMQHKAEEKNVYIEGLCASAATLLACLPGAQVHMAQGSMYMIHNPSVCACGDAEELTKAAETLKKLEGSFYDIYTAQTGKDRAQVKNWMDAESWFTAEEAVEAGFADEITECAEAAALAPGDDALALMRQRYAHVPADMQAHHEPISHVPELVAGEGTPEHTPNEGEEKPMDIIQHEKNAPQSAPQLNENEIRAQAVQAERERVAEIDALTDRGDPEMVSMAEKAKNDGTSSQEFFKAVVAKRNARPAAYLEERKNELAPAAGVGNGPEDDQEEKKALNEVMDFAKRYQAENAGGMF